MPNNYLVIRIHPDSPVDGGTFSTYLEGLQIQVYLADSNPPTLLGETGVDTANLNLIQIPWLANTFIASISKLVEEPTGPSGGNFGTTLAVQDGTGIAFGSVVTSTPGSSDLFSSNTVSVIPAAANPATLTLAQPIPHFVPAQTAVTFYFAYGPGSTDTNSPTITADYTGSSPSFQFNLKVKGKVTNSPTVVFDHSDGIAVGMQMTSATGVPAGTRVIAVPNGTSITLNNNVNLANNAAVTFQSNLNSGIVQHVEPLSVDTLFNTYYVPIPASVATAIIPFDLAVPASGSNSYLDVTVVVKRNGVPIPVETEYYDVMVSPGNAPAPDQYQAQPLQNTSFYLTLPPPPQANAIDLVVPSDGTAPSFDALYQAMQQVRTFDPYFSGADLSALSVNDITRMAYDIIWSQQGNILPPPPDPLESLYTNPPNPGGSGGNGSANNLEQDRQKFEGTVNGFYASRNAAAERLTKFVAAASAGLFCERTSLNASTALLEFPVDPVSSFASAVESELLLQGVGLYGTSGLVFGVPAGYFYALGASLDKSSTPTQRFQLATGDAIERLLQVFSAALQAGSITDSEQFQTQGIPLNGTSITAFQAARRLVALGVSAASNSPSEQVYAGTPLAQLVTDWLAQGDPTPTPTPNPPPTYEDNDFLIWSQILSVSDQKGYLFLDLDALTQGYVIAPFTDSPSAAAVAGATHLQFEGTGLGIAPPMPVSGTNIAPGTLVTAVSTVATVTLSAAVTGGGVTTATVITFSSAGASFTASPNANIAAGVTLTFAGTPVTEAIAAGMKVSGTNIAPGTTVVSIVTTATVTLSAATTGAVGTNDVLTFNAATPNVILTTSADCPAGSVLTFAATAGVAAGMSAYGFNLKAGTAVVGVSATTVTLHDAVVDDVPKGTKITFAMLAQAPSSLADQIAAWLPAGATVDTLKKVTAAQWTNFFLYTGNPSWLPPFTQPVGAGASPGPAANKAGYIAGLIRAFIRAVQQFFTVSSVATAAQLPAIGSPAVFDLAAPSDDPILEAAQSLSAILGAPFNFGSTITAANLAAAVADVFPDDPAAQAWLAQAVTAINELFEVASVVPPVAGVTLPNPVSLAFSVAEALYARGFRDASDISRLPAADFQQSLTGTIAYDYAAALQAKAASIPPAVASTGPSGAPSTGGFQAINPDGSLMNCVPPPCLSPAGPIAYLQEMLSLSQASTCENPGAAPGAGQTTLGAAVAARRGPLGNLLASCANLETPLPAIDIVNECLEYLGTAPATVSGTVYNTSADNLAGYELCDDGDCAKKDSACHAPATLYAALPEYSTPATPVAANAAVEPLVYDNLKNDFSSCDLPYSQALDVSRTYLDHLGSCRFEEMRTFRKCITEFALDPTNPPVGFESFLWRYPVRIETAIEYLGITPEEYATVFAGTPPQPCGQQKGDAPPRASDQILGFSAVQARQISDSGAIPLKEFLSATCLSYCEAVALTKSGAPVTIGATHAVTRGADDAQKAAAPECEPCCLGDYQVQIPTGDGRQGALLQLTVFIRLWRKLQRLCGAGYTFAQLYDICLVLKLFNGSAINPEFIRQLAAFQMLRDQFRLPLCDPKQETSAATGADRTHLLALWVGSSAKMWDWAKHRLLEGVEAHARARYRCEARNIAFLADHLDALSALAGFNPVAPSTDVWNSNPACTLRFAEVLAKICASQFKPEELLYLFTVAPPQGGEDPFPLQDADEALAYPLDEPENAGHDSLWKLREQLLCVEVCEEEVCELSWSRIVNEFRAHFGYAPPAGADPLLSLGQHFFPHALEQSGFAVSGKQRQYRTPLTSATAWNAPAGSPFQYDAGASELWIELPLGDEAVAAKLSRLPQLNAAEQAAVQDLYFAPRVDLGFVAFLFPDWQSAERHLIQEPDEHKRWQFFQRHFALANARRNAIAAHLAQHVAHRTGCRAEDLKSVAAIVLSSLFSDENTGTPWGSDNGAPPSVVWTPPPAGGAIPALLGLAGTGLLGEYQLAAAQAGVVTPIVWRDVRGPMEAFGHDRDETNSPVPSVLPPLALTDTTNPLIDVHNGYAVKTGDGHRLGGAAQFVVKWSGVLLVEREGEYAFHGGAPTPECEKPDFELAEKSSWRVTLQRGSKTFAVLNHNWAGNVEPEVHAPRLRRGAYRIAVEYSQPAPDFSKGSLHPTRTGFQVKYAGPDSEGRLISLPLRHLYRDFQDQTLDQGIAFLAGSRNAQAFLKGFYTSTLRDMRRTYQRAFKAVLFAGKLGLCARMGEDHRSELGFMLANPVNFAGRAYYRTSPTGFTQHLADFNFNFLPVADNYDPPAADGRSQPSLQQTQAMFDWWERLFDYTVVRKQVERRRTGPLWRIFEEAEVNPPANPAELLRHIGAKPAYWDLDLRYYQDQASAIYTVSSADLQDDRWLVRVWHADSWICRLMDRFHANGLSKARPDLWAAGDPGATVPASGVAQTGNANLLAFAGDACFNQHPRRYGDVKRLNDGLRERGRRALISYLCNANRVPLPWSPSTYATRPADLSDLLLLDVETGVCEKASRIQEAISAVQTFVRRSRLGLEPNWKVGREFIRMWESRFDTYRTWERCKRREIYRENWIEFTELGKARRIEAFRFLESQLRNSTLTLAAPGGLDWWQDDAKALEQAPKLLEQRVPSELTALTAPPNSASREGLATLGSPEYAARPSWLAAVPAPSSGTATGNTPAPANNVPALASAAASGGTQPVTLPFWMESAMNLGKQFLRIAAAGVPQASLGFEPHGEEPRDACCRQCGCQHPVLVDEYYFWLENTQFYQYTDQTDAQSSGDVSFSGSYQGGFQDSYYDPFQQQSAEWNEEDMVPSLLAKWEPTPAVRLAWCRVHNGQFGQPRKSDDYVAIASPADLVFLGRGGDSLYFQVTGSAALPPGYTADPSPAGFRYDLPVDQAIGVPQAIKPPALPSPSPYPGGLLSYPFFAYHDSGARLFPDSWFSPAMAVAEALRARCGFELALKWYARAFDPLNNDCTWMVCDTAPAGANTLEAEQRAPASACCDSSKVSAEVARHRAVVLHFCQTLVDWGDALMRRRRSPEAFQQARLLYDTAARITGCTPQTLLLPEPSAPATVTAFLPANPPLNPRLMDLYSLIGDRLGLIHTCYDARRLRNGVPDCDMPYWGDDPLRDGWRTAPETCAGEAEWCHRSSPYRFTYQIQKAQELAARVRELGAALLAAYEKGDAEALASIRAGQERDILALGIGIRQDQWRDADWQVQALQQTKDFNQTNLIYYRTLYQNGLINDEIQNQNLTSNAILTRTGANIVSAVGEFFHILPDSNVGALSTFLTLPTGKKMAFMFDTIARIMQTVADIQSTTASMDLIQAGWDRRSVEWFHQMTTLPIEIQQIELQILGAHRRRDQAMQELNSQQRQIENATEVLDFLRDKFTATDLYLFLQKETSALYRSMYDLAHRAADEAERAFNFERGHTTRRFLPGEMWDNLHEGLMAGERLDFALHHMEKAYLDENVREFELTKHFSLRFHFPEEFLRIKRTGRCEIELPEWMFDLDYPGQYMRRIRNITLTIPCVTGPYNGVHCRATLLSSRTRIDPRLDLPATRCCAECGSGHDYEACPHDPRIVRSYAAREAIATSSGQNDSGLFELNFRDERYLPFEFQGAVSRWRIELPRENNYFDMDTLSDVILNLNYTSREGGGMLRNAAMEAARKHLPGDGWCFFDVRHEFPDAWQMLRNSCREKGRGPRLGLRIERKMFPFIPSGEELSITGMAVLFHAHGRDGCECPESAECHCGGKGKPDCRTVEFSHGRKEDSIRVPCVRSEEWPELYYGVFDTEIGPVGKHMHRPEIEFGFPHDTGEVETVYLLCRYRRC